MEENAVEEESTLPKGVTGHRIAVAGSSGIFLVGGWNPTVDDGTGSFDRNYVREVWKYNASTGLWSKLRCSSDTAPLEMASHCMTSLGSKRLLCFGGSLSSIGQECSNRCHWYFVKEQIWQEIACNGNIPPQNLHHWFGQASFHCREENALYVASGVLSGPMLINRLDVSSCEWTALPAEADTKASFADCPGLVRHEIVVWKGELFVLGGGLDFQNAGPPELQLGQLPTFDLSSKRWSLTPCFGPPEVLTLWPFASSVVLHKDALFLCGGLDIGEANNRVLREILRLDLVTKTWSVFGLLPRPLWFHASSVTDEGELFVFGGCPLLNYNGPRNNELVTINVDVCSLQTLAWRVLMADGRGAQIASLSVDTLRSIGLSDQFVKMLAF
uniref:Uncharacterized protein n=1 Tax=Plectus sambesii TaxID=2011161 RepID=A0A914VTJ2_9BILA